MNPHEKDREKRAFAIGGLRGPADREWLEREFDVAGNISLCCGFITWSIKNKPELLDRVMARSPAALMLSFGAVKPFAEKIRQAGVPLICQVQTLAHAREAVDAGADVIVAQGGKAGGHADYRATLTLTPEIADYIAPKALPSRGWA